MVGALLGLAIFLGACSQGAASTQDPVVIYTNADDEPIQEIQKALDENGFKDQYLLQTFSTSELGGKLLAEGTNIEADLVTMSTFYAISAQEKNQLFQKLDVPGQTLQDVPDYTAPFTSQEGVIFYNTKALAEANLPKPTSLKDLTKPEYKGAISISDIKQSSTAWLLFQALVDTYGEKEAKEILQGIYANAGDHIEQSGSGPLKKVRVGEVVFGFGLRHQAVKDKKEGQPIDVIEPSEGTYSLTESLMVVDKGEKTNPKAQEMLAVIVEKARPEILKIYPNALYEGEDVSGLEVAKDPKVFPEPLTAELLEQHKKLVE